MKLGFRFTLAVALTFAAAGCDEFQGESSTPQCAEIPEIKPSEDPKKTRRAGETLELTLSPGLCEATICLSLDGSEPQEGRQTTFCAPGPIKKIPIRESTCIKYFVRGPSGSQSAVKEICYRFEPPPVLTCDPDSKSSNRDLEVTLRSSKETTDIYYTTDGSDPDVEAEGDATTKATAPVKIKVSKTTTIKAIGKDANGNLGSLKKCEYRIDKTPPVSTAEPTPGDPNAPGPIEVLIRTNEAATIYYTTDGSTPDPDRTGDLGSTEFAISQARVTLTQSTLLTFFAIDMVGNPEAQVNKLAYIFDGRPAVGVNPGGGFYPEHALDVELIGTTASGGQPEIWYTTDKSAPDKNGPNGTQYTPGSKISFTGDGEYTLRYIAYDGAKSTSGTAVYTLGVNAPPFTRTITFSDLDLLDSANSQLDRVEYNTYAGFARLRRLGPTYISGISDENNSRFNSYNTGLEGRLEPVQGGSDLYLYYATGFGVDVYWLNSPGGTPTKQQSKCVPEVLNDPFGLNPCGEGDLTGNLLGIHTFFDGSQVNGIVPWTNGGNTGGFARFRFNFGGSVTKPYNRGQQQQFETASADDPSAADPLDLGQFPKADAELVGDRIFLPRFDSGNHRIYAYRVTDGSQITAGMSPGNLNARAIALDSDADYVLNHNLLAVGDTTGQFYLLDRADLHVIANRPVSCVAAVPCRINDVEIMGIPKLPFPTSQNDYDWYAVISVGYYGDTITGQVAIAKISNTTRGIEWFTSAALPAYDDYRFTSSVEAVRKISDTLAVAAVNQQGLVYLDLNDLGNRTVHSLGYAQGSDFGDPYFFAVDLAMYPTAFGANRFVAIDAGRYTTSNGQPRTHAGFRIFDTPDVTKFKSSGTLRLKNINTSPKRILRVGFIGGTGCPTSPGGPPGPFPPGVTVKLVADNTVVATPILLGAEMSFQNPPLEVGVQLEFAGNGTSSQCVKSLQFQLWPVQ